jgi:hypothetical protein
MVVAEGAADREAEVTDPDLVRVGEADGDQRLVLGIDLQEREVGLRIGADDLGTCTTLSEERSMNVMTSHLCIGR